MSLEKAAEAIESGIAILEQDGWLQKSYWLEDFDGNYNGQGACIVGSLILGICGRDTNLCNSFAELESEARDGSKAIARHLGISYVSVWNDDPDRTKEEVLEAMTSTAKAIRNGEIK